MPDNVRDILESLGYDVDALLNEDEDAYGDGGIAARGTPVLIA